MKFFFSKKAEKKEIEPTGLDTIDDEIVAVIGVALRLYSYQTRAHEETLATIQKAIRPYSPWNSKIYNMKQMPFHRTPSRRLKF